MGDISGVLLSHVSEVNGILRGVGLFAPPIDFRFVLNLNSDRLKRSDACLCLQ